MLHAQPATYVFFPNALVGGGCADGKCWMHSSYGGLRRCPIFTSRNRLAYELRRG